MAEVHKRASVFPHTALLIAARETESNAAIDADYHHVTIGSLAALASTYCAVRLPMGLGL